MAEVDLQRRVEILEEKMHQLQDVPVRLAAVESQILHLRGEIGTGFSAVRREMHELGGALRAEMREVARESEDRLRSEMRALNDETRSQMRALHEEVISRLAILQEGLPSRRRSPRR